MRKQIWVQSVIMALLAPLVASTGPWAVRAQPVTEEALEGASKMMAMDPEEAKRLQAVMDAEILLEEFAGATDAEMLLAAERIALTLEAYSTLAPQPRPLRPALLLLNARAMSDPNRGARVVEAWRTAVAAERHDPARLDLLLEAAKASGTAGELGAARGFLSEAKKLVEDREGRSALLDIQFKVRELLVTGAARDWREVEDEISDMRLFAERFPFWTRDRLEVLLLEASLRLDAQPDDTNKRERVRSVKAELSLAYDAQREMVPQQLKNRYRNLMRAIDDTFLFTASQSDGLEP